MATLFINGDTGASGLLRSANTDVGPAATGSQAPSRRRKWVPPADRGSLSRFGSLGRPGSRRARQMAQRIRLGDFRRPPGSSIGQSTSPDIGKIDMMYGEQAGRRLDSRVRRLPKRPVPGPFWRLFMGDQNGNMRGWAGNALDSLCYSGVDSSNEDEEQEEFQRNSSGDAIGARRGSSGCCQGFAGFRWDIWTNFLDVTEAEQEQLIEEIAGLRVAPTGVDAPKGARGKRAAARQVLKSNAAAHEAHLLRVKCPQQRAALVRQFRPQECSPVMRMVDLSLFELARNPEYTESGRLERRCDSSFHRYLVHGLCAFYGLRSQTVRRPQEGAAASVLVVERCDRSLPVPKRALTASLSAD